MSNQVPDRVGDSGDEVEELDEEEGTALETGPHILSRPDILAALQSRDHFLMLQALPPAVKRRLKALKKLQLEATKIEATFFEEVHKLECKYRDLYAPLFTKREEIVTGVHEPTEDECDFPSDDEKDNDDLCNELRTKINMQSIAKEDAVGIPDFWLTIFKNVALLSDMVQPHDEPILKHLLDVKVKFMPADPMGFILEFYFGPNEFFSNLVLTKEYEMKCKPDDADPFSFEGPEIYKCKGCVIDWYKGKNVTIKTIKKKQKHKSKGSIRTVTKTVENDSFFNFFNPPHVPDDLEAELDDDIQALLTSDFEIGHYIKERIIPRAVLYYTGEALEDEEEEYDDEEPDDEDDEELDENETDRHVQQKLSQKPTIKTAMGEPVECKQQ